jgi:four helix bundle protein
VDRLEAQFREWQNKPPRDLVGDSLWRLTAFRMSLFMSDVARRDAIRLLQRGAPGYKINQLERSVESVEANVAEGYSKFSGKERARFFETALGSAREAREWYRRSSEWLGTAEAEERRMLLTQIIKILTVAIPRERGGASQRRIQTARTRPANDPSC